MTLIDLHTHTSASDGTDSPAELVEKAHAAGLAAVAVTDHDTVAGLDAAVQRGLELGITVVRGCELSTSSECGEMHVLGLWLPQDTTPLMDILKVLRDKRGKRNEKIVEKLRDLGFAVTLDQVREQARGESVGRPHIAAALLKNGCVRSVRDAFTQYLGHGGKAYVPKEILSSEEAARTLADMGALVCLAHPMLRSYPEGRLEAFVGRLVGHGLGAIEVWHSDHGAAAVRAAMALARRYDLGMSGGSDYHGANKPGIRLGRGYGKLRVGLDVLAKLVQRREDGIQRQSFPL